MKCRVLTHVGEMRPCRNDHYYCYYFCPLNSLLGQLVVQGTVGCVACHTSDGGSIIDWLHPTDHDSCIRGRKLVCVKWTCQCEVCVYKCSGLIQSFEIWSSFGIWKLVCVKWTGQCEVCIYKCSGPRQSSGKLVKFWNLKGPYPCLERSVGEMG